MQFFDNEKVVEERIFKTFYASIVAMLGLGILGLIVHPFVVQDNSKDILGTKISQAQLEDYLVLSADYLNSYSVSEHGARDLSALSSDAARLGVIESSYAVLTKYDEISGRSYVHQYISRYPKENMNQVFDSASVDWDSKLNGAKKQTIQLGDRAAMYSAKTPDYGNIRVIIFVEKDIYVSIVVLGADSDKSTGNDTATIISARI